MTNEQIQQLRQIFDYNPDTGELFRKLKKGLVKQKQSLSSNGYARVGVFSRRIHAHRIIWAWVNNELPSNLDIDHINGNRSDNRIKNLRAVDRSTNLQNIKGPRKDNKSTGILGAYKYGKNKFASRIRVRGKDVYLGTFVSAEAAHQAYMEAKRKYHEGAVL